MNLSTALLAAAFAPLVAAPMAPQPACRVAARVLSARKVSEAYEIPDYLHAGKTEKGRREYYGVKLEIRRLLGPACAEDRARTQNRTCAEDAAECASLYRPGSRRATILDPGAFDAETFRAGSEIRGLLHEGGDEWFNGTFLTEVRRLPAGRRR